MAEPDSIDILCSKYIDYVNLVRAVNRDHALGAPNPSSRSVSRYHTMLTKFMDDVMHTDFDGNEHSYFGAYHLLFFVGPFLDIHGSEITDTFKRFAERCGRCGVNPDLQGVLVDEKAFFDAYWYSHEKKGRERSSSKQGKGRKKGRKKR